MVNRLALSWIFKEKKSNYNNNIRSRATDLHEHSKQTTRQRNGSLNYLYCTDSASKAIVKRLEIC